MEYLIIVGAGLAAWVLGALWYGPIFGKAWMAEMGFSQDDAPDNMAVIFGLSFLLMVLMMFGLSHLIQAHTEITWTHGFYHGCMIGIFFAATSMGINYLYQRKSIKLWLIDASYQILFLGVGGAIMAAFL